MLKLIIDTNIWISFLIGKNLKGLHYFLQDNRFQIITSNEQISELIDVLSRPKLQKYFSKVQYCLFGFLSKIKLIIPPPQNPAPVVLPILWLSCIADCSL